jgi:hypothetical protein
MPATISSCRPFSTRKRPARVTGLWTTEFGAGLALAALVVALIFYAKRGELPAQRESESAPQTSSISPAAA